MSKKREIAFGTIGALIGANLIIVPLAISGHITGKYPFSIDKETVYSAKTQKFSISSLKVGENEVIIEDPVPTIVKENKINSTEKISLTITEPYERKSSTNQKLESTISKYKQFYQGKDSLSEEDIDEIVTLFEKGDLIDLTKDSTWQQTLTDSTDFIEKDESNTTKAELEITQIDFGHPYLINETEQENREDTMVCLAIPPLATIGFFVGVIATPEKDNKQGQKKKIKK